MPNYYSRQEPAENSVVPEQLQLNNEILNTNGMGNVLEKPVPEKPVESDMLGGAFMNIMNSDKPHHIMIDKVLKLKPYQIHLIKRGAKYFLDHQDELTFQIPEEALEDLSKTKNANDLADMLENDYEFTQGGEQLENSLVEGLGLIIEDLSKHSKFKNK